MDRHHQRQYHQSETLPCGASGSSRESVRQGDSDRDREDHYNVAPETERGREACLSLHKTMQDSN